MSRKNYVLDTNVLLENEKCIEILRNGEENNIFIPATVIEELDKLKRDKRKKHQVTRAVEALKEHQDHITIIHNGVKHESPDNYILKEILSNEDKIPEPIFVTNDNLLRFKAQKQGIVSEEFKDSNPFKSESQKYTGFVDVERGEMIEKNCFYWKDGRLYFNNRYGEEVKVEDREIWKVSPRTQYQKAAMELILNDDLDLITIQSEAGFGKAQPLYSQILTPMGWKSMGNIEIGDTIIGQNGESNKVIGVYPQGKKDIYRVHFNDGSYTDTCKEHLWNIRYWSGGVIKWRTVELQSIMNDLYDHNRNRWKYFIPMVEPVNFNKQEVELDPYLMGILLGDGSFRGGMINFTSVDGEIIESVKNMLPDGYGVSLKSDGISYNITMNERSYDTSNGIINKVKEIIYGYGLLDRKSIDKFIPSVYKFNDIETRISILQGLMDSDGSINKTSQNLEFYTKSSMLKDDVVFLVQSLGGKCKVNVKDSKYKKDGEYIECGEFYALSISLPDNIEPFKLKRKLDIYKQFNKYPPSRCIVNVEYLGRDEAQCIMVDADDHLYVTDNFIVTHNTFVALAAMFYQVFEKKRFKKIFIFKANIEIGNELGFLPGDMNEKMYPYFRPIQDLMEKLHDMRIANGAWEDPQAVKLELNRRKVEMLPINFLRGMNIDDAIVLIDEVQNLSRDELRTVLSRMGENVKVICTGDVRQIDNIHLNQDNNGLNWLVKLLRGQDNYGHVVLGGNKSRGPIADLIRESGL